MTVTSKGTLTVAWTKTGQILAEGKITTPITSKKLDGLKYYSYPELKDLSSIEVATILRLGDKVSIKVSNVELGTRDIR